MNCLKTTTIQIGATSACSIGLSAFENCGSTSTSAGTLTIGTGVTTIGDYAFNGMTGLTTINYNATSVSNKAEDNGADDINTA